MKDLLLPCLLALVLLSACEKDSAQVEVTNRAETQNTEARLNRVAGPNIQLENARQKLVYGNASLAEVRQPLAEKDVANLTNTMHALYSMRWHRGVFTLLYRMWELDSENYPELNWEAIAKEPVRVALASTLNRIQISDTLVFQDYIRSFKEHEHEFVRAQVTVALGFNGDPKDIAYLQEMADGENEYVAQTAITGLGLMSNDEAKNVLISLGKRYQETERGAVINGMLRDGYKVVLKETVEQ